MAKDKDEKRPTGNDYRKKNKLVSIGLTVSPESHELIRRAAFVERQSLASFCAQATVDRAREVLAGTDPAALLADPSK